MRWGSQEQRPSGGGRQLSLFRPGKASPADLAVAISGKPLVTADCSPRFDHLRMEMPRFEQRLILLLDMDAFFASAEQVARPQLKGKPVIVGGLVGDRSVVASASYEARALGVKTAMPITQAYRICPQGIFLRGSYALYSEFSRKVMEICNTFTPLVEQASIDEAYLDLTGTQGCRGRGTRGEEQQTSRQGEEETRRNGNNGLDKSQASAGIEHGPLGRTVAPNVDKPRVSAGVRSDVQDVPGATPDGERLRAAEMATAGLAGVLSSAVPQDFPAAASPLIPRSSLPPFWPLAVAENLLREIRRQTGLGASVGIGANKLIARIAMESAKPGGVCFVWPGYEAVFLADKPLKTIPGIGPQTAGMLEDYNLRTASDVQKTDRDLLVATFGERLGQMLHDCAWGRGQTHLEQEREQKSISRDTSFEQDTTDMGFIKAMLYYLAERACRSLRQMGQAAWTVSVKLRYSDFATVAKSQTLDEPTNHDDRVYNVAEGLLTKLYTRQISIRLVGVQLSGLASAGQIQMSLWDPRYLKQGRLYEASDLIRDRFGFCALMKGPAIELMGKMEQDRAGLKLRTSCLTR